MADLKSFQKNATTAVNRKTVSTNEIMNEIRGIKRKDKTMNANYNKNNLTDDQIDKLITDNYNLDFLEVGG